MSLGFDFPGLVKRLVEHRGLPVDLATSAALEAYRANLRMFDSLMDMIRSREPFGGGTVVCAASGNESERQIDPTFEMAASLPAAADDVVSVGALGPRRRAVRRPVLQHLPEISAPGVGVRSAKAGGGLRDLNGTSMATPHVAGIAALWWEQVLATPVPARRARSPPSCWPPRRPAGSSPGRRRRPRPGHGQGTSTRRDCPERCSITCRTALSAISAGPPPTALATRTGPVGICPVSGFAWQGEIRMFGAATRSTVSPVTAEDRTLR